jgi:hypothetical protein
MEGSEALDPDTADSCNKLKERVASAFYRGVNNLLSVGLVT